MKIDTQRAPFLLLTFAILASADAGLPQGSQLARRGPVPASDPAVDSHSGPVGREHAPVDGKDGMPHDGPWIETETDRKNQKLKDGTVDEDEEEAVYDSETKATTDMPQTNDGVMDDPNRKVPDAASRGVAGGVSQRAKDGTTLGKQPERPKEAPPLPHSEKEKLSLSDDDVLKSDDTAGLPDDESRKPQKFDVSRFATHPFAIC
jgi:Ca2+/H+ antiporter, TMEM165/GDT1 family